MRISLLKTATIAASLTLIGAPSRAQTALQPIIEVHGRATNSDGGASWTAKGDSAFVPGQPVTWLVVAGSSHPGDMTVCGGGVSEVVTLAEKLAGHSFVWKLTILPASYENGRQTFDLDWARYRRDGGERPSAQGKATVTLSEGQPYVVDLVHGGEFRQLPRRVGVDRTGRRREGGSKARAGDPPIRHVADPPKRARRGAGSSLRRHGASGRRARVRIHAPALSRSAVGAESGGLRRHHVGPWDAARPAATGRTDHPHRRHDAP